MSRKPPRRTYTAEEKVGAVALAVEDGLMVAAEQTGIPKSTLSGWLTDEERAEMHARSDAKTAQATQEASRRWAAVRAEIVGEAGDCARRLVELIAHAIDEVPIDSARDAKDAATAAAILIDKAQLLNGDATSRPAMPWDPEAVKADAERRAEGLRVIEGGGGGGGGAEATG